MIKLIKSTASGLTPAQEQRWEAWVGENMLQDAWNKGDVEKLMQRAESDNLTDREKHELYTYLGIA